MWRQNPDALIERATSYSPTLGRFVSLHLEIHGNPRVTHNILKRLLYTGSARGKATIDAACVEAIRRTQINADTMRQILGRGPRKPTRHEPGPSQPPSDNIRGAGYYAENDNDAA